MALINLNVLDTPIVEQTNFSPDMQRWLSNIVDIINSNFALLGLSFAQGINIGGGGAGPINVTVTGLTPSGLVNVNLVSTTNPNISILSVVPGTNQFSITFSGDPGASAIITYTAFTSSTQ